MDRKKDKQRRRSVRLMKPEREEPADNGHLIDKFESEYGSIWKDLSPGYQESRRKSTTGRRSAIFRHLPVLEPADTPVKCDGVLSPELSRGPDSNSANSSLVVKCNTSVESPAQQIVDQEESSNDAPAMDSVFTPADPSRMRKTTTDFDSPDYPEGILISQYNNNNLYQSPQFKNVTPDKKPMSNVNSSPDKKPMTISKSSDDSIPYSPSQPVFSTPFINLQRSTSDTLEPQDTALSPPETETENEDPKSDKRGVINCQASARKTSTKKKNIVTETLEEKEKREKRETSKFFQICKSLASRLSNAVRRHPDNSLEENPQDNVCGGKEVDKSNEVSIDTEPQNFVERKMSRLDNTEKDINSESSNTQNIVEQNDESDIKLSENVEECKQGSSPDGNEVLCESAMPTACSDLEKVDKQLGKHDEAMSEEAKISSPVHVDPVRLENIDYCKNAISDNVSESTEDNNIILQEPNENLESENLIQQIPEVIQNCEQSKKRGRPPKRKSLGQQVTSHVLNDSNKLVEDEGKSLQKSLEGKINGNDLESSNEDKGNLMQEPVENSNSKNLDATEIRRKKRELKELKKEQMRQLILSRIKERIEKDKEKPKSEIGETVEDREIDKVNKTTENSQDPDQPKKKRGRPSKRKSIGQVLSTSSVEQCNEIAIDACKDIDDSKKSNNIEKENKESCNVDVEKSKPNIDNCDEVDCMNSDNVNNEKRIEPSIENIENDTQTSDCMVQVNIENNLSQQTVEETKNEIMLTHQHHKDFDKIKDFLSMDDEPKVQQVSRSRKGRGKRRSTDAITLSESTGASEGTIESGEEIPVRRTTRLKRRSVEVYQAGECTYSNETDTDSPADSACLMETKTSPSSSDDFTIVKQKIVRKRKIKEVSVEDIYRNKNYKKPEDKMWETIYESPGNLKNPDQLLSKKRFKRSIAFETVLPTKIKKRTKRAADNGWDAKRRKKQQLTDEYVIEKLSELDNLLNS